MKAQELIQKIEDGVKETLESNRWRDFLEFAGNFHTYSFYNCWLIFQQLESATRVAGYRKWQQMGRQVRKGEKALKILYPRFRKNDEGERVLISFGVGNVFDISQTEGEEIPQICVPLRGDDRGIYSYLASMSEKIGYRIEVRPIRANGFCDYQEKLIGISEGLEPAAAAKTLAHELAHAVLHGPDSDTERPTKEMEAESVAFMVCRHFGLDTSEYSFEYLAHWVGDDDFSTLMKKSGGRIIKAANAIIDNGDESPYHEVGE